jgi:transposase
MQEKINEKTFEGQSIYVGIDVHKKDWKVTIMTGELSYKTFSSVPRADKLGSYLRNNFPGATYYSAYEAGFSGFWLHKELTALGIKSIVVNPADIPTTDKERKQKEDVRDSRKIAHSLRAGQLKGIYIPNESIQNDRMLLRTRHAMVKDLNRSKNRIKSLLFFLGINLPDRFSSSGSRWSRPFITWLEELPLNHPTARASLDAHLDQVRHLRSSVLRITRQITELARSNHYQENVALLISMPGIGMLTAMMFLTELGNIERFKTFDELCSYVGLVPSTSSSGENDIDTGITPRRNARLRSALIESAWVAIRNDPALLSAYQGLMKRMPGNRAIVRIAKKLLRRMTYVLREKTNYERGVIK